MYLTPEFERTLKKFVLGGLEDGPRMELEELLVTDPEAFEALGVIEDELIEEYLEGAGSPADRGAFERHFLSSGEGRRRLGFARALRGTVMTSAPPGKETAGPKQEAAVAALWPPTWPWRRWPPVWVGLAALLSVSVAGNAWLGLRYQVQGERLAHLSGPNAAAAGSSRQTGKAPDAQPARPRSAVSTFTLAAGLLRAGGTLPRIAVPTDAAVVRLRLELPGDEYPRYRVSLRDADGNEIWSMSKLRAERERDETAVTLVVPSELLPRGDYQLKLSGVRPGGGAEPLAMYSLRVSHP